MCENLYGNSLDSKGSWAGSSRELSAPLLSAFEITDGSRHSIGFVWDGLYRMIYVDDIPVAEDIQQGSVGGLNIGCEIDPAAGTFWSGMIDEVRIYGRAVRP